MTPRDLPVPGPGRPTRRRLLAGAAGTVGLVLLGACRGDGTGGGALTGAGDPTYLRPFFATGLREPPVLRTGVSQRLPWGIADADGVPLRSGPATVTFVVRGPDGGVVGEVAVERHDGSVPFPYYPLRFTPPTPGTYEVAADAAGRRLTSAFAVAAPGDVRLVQVGDPAVPVDTATFDDPRGVDPVCTRDPACPFHAVTLRAALASGRPTVFLVSTPAFCQTNVCGPVLEQLVTAVASRPDLVVVHSEVYADVGRTKDPLRSKFTPAIDAYGLTFEPSLVVADARGVVVERLDFTWDERELAAALARI